jgi:hypothetical protein
VRALARERRASADSGAARNPVDGVGQDQGN